MLRAKPRASLPAARIPRGFHQAFLVAAAERRSPVRPTDRLPPNWEKLQRFQCRRATGERPGIGPPERRIGRAAFKGCGAGVRRGCGVRWGFD
jgi:hypothetical protein